MGTLSETANACDEERCPAQELKRRPCSCSPLTGLLCFHAEHTEPNSYPVSTKSLRPKPWSWNRIPRFFVQCVKDALQGERVRKKNKCVSGTAPLHQKRIASNILVGKTKSVSIPLIIIYLLKANGYTQSLMGSTNFNQST